MYEPGTEVKVAYTGYTIQATVIERTRDGEVYHNGWYPVRQNIGIDSLGNVQEHNDYTDRPLDERPEFLAGEEYISLMDEPTKPGPFENMARALGYFVPPTCENCYATLDGDGNHWVTGKAECR